MRHVWRGVVVVVSAAILTVTVTAAFGAIDLETANAQDLIARRGTTVRLKDV